jgi:hypothetical protein
MKLKSEQRKWNQTIRNVEVKTYLYFCFTLPYCEMNAIYVCSRSWLRFFCVFAACLGSQGDGPYPVASTTLGIHQQVLLGEGGPMGLCPHSPMLMTTVVSWCCITLVTLAAGWAHGNATRNRSGVPTYVWVCMCACVAELATHSGAQGIPQTELKGYIYWLLLRAGSVPSFFLRFS